MPSQSLMSYFSGSKCNQDWMKLESPAAKKSRGGGWMTFRRIIIAQHGMKCDSCLVTMAELWAKGKALDVHHIIKIRDARHLRFEPSNLMVLCGPCHHKFERVGTNGAPFLSTSPKTNTGHTVIPTRQQIKGVAFNDHKNGIAITGAHFKR